MEPGVLKDIVIIFALSTFVNFIFTRIRIPAIIGYLITGVIAGPHLLRLISSPENVEVMAEIGGLLFYRPEPAEARVRPRGPALALAV